MGCSMIGQIVFNSGGLGANRNVSGKLGNELAILMCWASSRAQGQREYCRCVK